jgi:hypothetical protein
MMVKNSDENLDLRREMKTVDYWAGYWVHWMVVRMAASKVVS